MIIDPTQISRGSIGIRGGTLRLDIGEMFPLGARKLRVQDGCRELDEQKRSEQHRRATKRGAFWSAVAKRSDDTALVRPH